MTSSTPSSPTRTARASTTSVVQPDVTQTKAQPELVVLVHGICSNRYLMLPLAMKLRRSGYQTRLWTYLSLFGSNRKIGKKLAAEIHRLHATGKYGKIHLVVHSMGSIVTRCALTEELPESLGRVVMLGPPNGGSHMATTLTPIYGWLTSTLVELSDKPDSFVNQLPAPPDDVDIGVLAAEWDHVIHLEQTHLPGQRDHRVLNTWHTGVLWFRETCGEVVHFLKHGTFKTNADCGIANAE